MRSLPSSSTPLLSYAFPAGNSLPGATSSSPVGMNATRGLATTSISEKPHMASTESFVGVRRVPAGSKSWSAWKSAPFWRQFAKRRSGVLRMRSSPGFSVPTPTTPIPPSNSAASMQMEQSNPSGSAVPVLAQSYSRPSCHALVSGMPSAKSSKRTAMPSICEHSALGTSMRERHSVAVTRMWASCSPTVSVRGAKSAAAMSFSIAASRVSFTWFEWSRMRAPLDYF